MVWKIAKHTRDLMIDGDQGIESYHVFGGQEIDLTSEDCSIDTKGNSSYNSHEVNPGEKELLGKVMKVCKGLDSRN